MTARGPLEGLRAVVGVEVSRLVLHGDPRGDFAELWRAQGTSPIAGFAAVQANLSTSAVNVLRGMHVHRRQIDRWIVLAGAAFVAVADVRSALAGSDSPPSVATAVMKRGDIVTIPEGVAHGFLALQPLELAYFVTNEFDGTDELGFRWDDALAQIPWPQISTPDGRPIVSGRDATNPPLEELLAALRN